jgi:hypothetical protein
MFKEERDESQFAWSMLSDIEEGRPNLGPMVHVAVYRLMQFTLRDLGIGIFRVESADYEKGSFVVTVVEALDCSGIPVCSEEVCIWVSG